MEGRCPGRCRHRYIYIRVSLSNLLRRKELDKAENVSINEINPNYEEGISIIHP